MEPTSAETLCNLLSRSRLLSADEVRTLYRRWLNEGGTAGGAAAAFAKWLVAGQHLTDFQAGLLLRGHADRFFLNDYKLLERIGTGRMAGVYRASHRLGQTVAVKVLPPSKAKDTTAFGRFQREARLAQKLKHPNVVRTFQMGQADGLHYLVMEYLDGETLEEVLQRRKRLPVTEAARVIQQALLGLEHLHAQDVVHRDLKPGNLMLVPAPEPGKPDDTSQATVKILDVGLGRALFDEGDAQAGPDAELTAKGDVLGTPDYMAPEQARDAHAADIRADTYALGCVFYHCLTGQPPFPGSNLVQKLVAHAKEPPKPLKTLGVAAPDGLQAVLDKLMAKDPAQRYPTPTQAAEALQPFLQAGSEGLRSPEADPRMRSFLNWLEADSNAGAPPAALAAAAAPAVTVPARRVERVAPAREEPQPRHNMGLVLAGVAALCLVVVLGVVLVLWLRPGSTEPESTPSPEHVAEEKKDSFDEWVEHVRSLKPEEQVAAVATKLGERNPGFARPAGHKILDGQVAELKLVADPITDLTPLRALPALNSLVCAGSAPGKSKLADLTPLQRMRLAVLDVSSTNVADLAPLREMPLIYLSVAGTQVRDLTPVQDMPLMVLNCAGTPVRDLTPLAGRDLTLLDVAGTSVVDLSPLLGMKLEALWCRPFQPRRDGGLLSLKGLKEINDRPVAEIWKEFYASKEKTFGDRISRLAPAAQVEEVAAQLKELNPGFDSSSVTWKEQGGVVVELRFISDAVTDLTPVRWLDSQFMPAPGLQRLVCPASAPGKSRLASLEPLRGLQLVELDCADTQVRDLTPLRGSLTLTELNLQGNAAVVDLTPLAGLKLTRLNIAGTGVKDLTPLGKMPLEYLVVYGTAVGDLTALQGLPLRGLTADLRPARDLEVLRSLKGLEKINNGPATKFWKQVRAFDEWAKRVAAKSPTEQVKEVEAALKAINPDFDGPLTPRIVKDTVIELTLPADRVMDLTPVRALPRLRRLNCAGSAPGKGKLDDLWPLYGLSLKELAIPSTAVRDLTPLRGLKLEALNLANTPVSDLSALQEMQLKTLDIRKVPVTDLSPLLGLPLKDLKGDFEPGQDATFLQALPSLVTVNGKRVADFLKSAATAKRNAPTLPRRLTPSARLAGKLIRVDRSRKRLTIQLTRGYMVQDPWHTACIVSHQIRLQSAGTIRNPLQRMQYIQDHMNWIAYHQKHQYSWRQQNENIEVEAAADVAVRIPVPPAVYDPKSGQQRRPTEVELRKMRGPDPRLPGFTAAFDDLRARQLIEVYLARPETFRLDPKDAESGTPEQPKRALPPLQVVTVLIVQDAL
jgi:Leucine-rich repeat (LRR) protein